MSILRHCCLFFLLFLSSIAVVQGQTEWKTWDAAHFSLGITKKLSTKMVYMKSFNMSNAWKNEFNQATWQTDYDFNRKFSVRGAFVYTFVTGSVNDPSRILLRGTYTSKVAKKFNWSNALQVERHSLQEDEYRFRLIYVTRFAPAKRLKFLKLAPSISYMLYYNIGGSPIQYYDEAGSETVVQTPDGFHRGRFYLNLNSKINRNFSVSLYYMRQSEFNFLSGKNRQMNIRRPTGKISRPFDNYHVMGVSLMYNLNLFKSKKTSKKSVKNATSQKDDNLRRDL